MKRKYALLILLCALLVFSGCGTVQLEVPGQAQQTTLSDFQQQDTPAFEADYYSAFSPGEYLLHLQRIFVSLYPLRTHDSKLGLAHYVEIFGADTPILGGDNDVLDLEAAAMQCSNIPVFYGLLAETQRYLSEHGINYDSLAQDYGKAHALRGEDVQAMANLLLRKQAALAFSSVAGAEYIEEKDLFVYDTLTDPYRGFTDKGWTLEFLGQSTTLDTGEHWGATNTVVPTMGCFWYDPASGAYYDLDGVQLGLTHNLEGLSDGIDCISVWKTTTFSSGQRRSFKVSTVRANYAIETVTEQTPILSVFVGSQMIDTGEVVSFSENTLTDAELTELSDTFFDDYYHDSSAGEKTTNYALANFFSKPEELDIAFLPLQSENELEQWCRQYLGISSVELQAPQQLVGTKECDIPYIAFFSGKRQDDLLILRYYNEMLRQHTILTLRQTDEGYQFVSNLPET